MLGNFDPAFQSVFAPLEPIPNPLLVLKINPALVTAIFVYRTIGKFTTIGATRARFEWHWRGSQTTLDDPAILAYPRIVRNSEMVTWRLVFYSCYEKVGQICNLSSRCYFSCAQVTNCKFVIRDSFKVN